jgi:hypothetical protein
MPNLSWLRSSRSRRARWTNAWIGVVLIAGGLLFLTIRLGESAREAAATKRAAQPPAASVQNHSPTPGSLQTDTAKAE